MKISLYADRAADFSPFCSHGGSAYTVFATGQLSITRDIFIPGSNDQLPSPLHDKRRHRNRDDAASVSICRERQSIMEPPDISTVNRGTGRLRGPAMPYIPPSRPWQDRSTRPRRHPSRSSGRCLFHARPTPLPDLAPRGRQYAAGA